MGHNFRNEDFDRFLNGGNIGDGYEYVFLATLTRDRAKKCLKMMGKNRKLSKIIKESYKRDIIELNWHLTGDPIRFDINRELVDGQHRIQAFIDSGNSSIPVVVAVNLNPVVKKVIDAGKKRTYANQLQINDYKYATEIASALNYLINQKMGRVVKGLTHSEKDEFFSNHPGISDSVLAIRSTDNVPKGLVAMLHYVGNNCLKQPQPEAVSDFINVLEHGSINNDPAQALVLKLMKDRSGKQKLRQAYVEKLAVYAFNRKLEGRTLHNFVLPEGFLRVDGLDVDSL